MNVREKLEVIVHLGDHISYKEDVGICYDSTLAKVIEDAYMELKNGVTVQEWISVKDRLPVKDGWYLCFIRPSVFRGAAYHTILPYDQHGFRTGYGYTDDVTHWMPLPQPPKGE